MKQLTLALIAATLFTGCGVQPTAPSVTAPQTQAGHTDARLLESFSAHLVKKSENDGLWSLGFTAKSLTGKTYKDENLLGFVDGGFNAGVSDVLLGQDGNLYVNALYEVAEDEKRTKTREIKGWFKVGTYKAPAALKEGASVSYKFDGGSRCKMNWKGINPMGDDFMMFYLGKKSAATTLPEPALLK